MKFHLLGFILLFLPLSSLFTINLNEIDEILLPFDCQFEIVMDIETVLSQKLSYRFQVDRNYTNIQKILWLEPEFTKNDVGYLYQNKIYFQNANWPKPEIFSYESSFLDTPFSWDMILFRPFCENYKINKIYDTNDYKIVDLQPIQSGNTPISLWIDTNSDHLSKIIYYNQSGIPYKSVNFNNYEIKNTKIHSFKAEIEHQWIKSKAKIWVSKIEEKKYPAKWYQEVPYFKNKPNYGDRND